jgi:2-polyprenyl-3-methyl-5-hydroxy-6-metoxy-1,4-benzoquinol methylase
MNLSFPISVKILHKGLTYKLIRYFYSQIKRRAIIQALQNSMNPLEKDEPFGRLLDERIVEYPWLFSKLHNFSGRLLDAGSVLNFDYLLSALEIDNKSIFISTLAPEKKAFWQLGVSYVYEDMRNSCFKDGYFDCIVCLSVIEHVGMDNTKLYTSDQSKMEKTNDSYLLFISELRRMLKPGGRVYLSMPFGHHQSYGWLQVFDESMVNRIVTEFRPTGEVIKHYFRYHNNGWSKSDSLSASQCRYFDYHCQTQKISNIKAIAAESVVLLELTK